MTASGWRNNLSFFVQCTWHFAKPRRPRDSFHNSTDITDPSIPASHQTSCRRTPERLPNVSSFLSYYTKISDFMQTYFISFDSAKPKVHLAYSSLFRATSCHEKYIARIKAGHKYSASTEWLSLPFITLRYMTADCLTKHPFLFVIPQMLWGGFWSLSQAFEKPCATTIGLQRNFGLVRLVTGLFKHLCASHQCLVRWRL